MGFKLFTDAEVELVEFGDRSSYQFNAAGFLVVITDEGKRITFSPNAWSRIEDHPNASVW